jgi:hypothetical protein
MKKTWQKKYSPKKYGIRVGTITLMLIAGCAPLPGGGYPSNYPTNSYPYPQGGTYDPYAYERDRRERERLERERDRLDDERRRLEDQRRELEDAQRRPPPPPPRPVEHCPAGFSPSENKCSREERRRGCQDMRLPGGLGCVRR